MSPNPGPDPSEIPIPPNYVDRTPPKAKPPGITGRSKSPGGGPSPFAEAWAKGHAAKFGTPLTLEASATTMVLGHSKRVSVPVAGIRFARPSMLYQATPAVVCKLEGGETVETWVLALEDPVFKYTLDDADALAEIIQKGLIPAYRYGKVMVGPESWYDNAKELPDYASVIVVNWPLEVSTRDTTIGTLKAAVAAAKSSEQNAWESTRNRDARHAEEVKVIHGDWTKEHWITHVIYIVLIVILLVGCLLLPSCHPWMAAS